MNERDRKAMMVGFDAGWDAATAYAELTRPPCGTHCPGECGYDPTDPGDPCDRPDYRKEQQ